MLNEIKNMILEKKQEQDEMSLILNESGVMNDLDESLILEDFEDEENDSTEEGEDLSDDSDNNEEPSSEENDIDLDDDNDVEGSDYNPSVEEIDDKDLLSVEIDLTSNTVSDVLPIPPTNAADAVSDENILSQRIDSGFGDDNKVQSEDPQLDTNLDDENPLDSPTAPIEIPEDDLLNSSINKLDDKEEDNKEQPVEESGNLDLLSEAIVTGGETEESDNGEAKKDDESVVTAAVKGKVKEAEGKENTEEDDSLLDEPIDAPEEPTEVGEDISDVESDEPVAEDDNEEKVELFKKLAGLSKNIEDIKMQVGDMIK